MAREIMVMLMVVVSDDVAAAAAQLQDLRGRELPTVPGSWVSRVAVHTDLEALRARLRPTPDTSRPAGAVDSGSDPDDPEREFLTDAGPDDPDDDPRRLLH